MPAPLQLTLSPADHACLDQMSRTDPLPYLRERATALLEIAEAHASGREVALHGLLRTRQPDTIYAWVHRFQAQGVKGLTILPGRGRKPAFSPCAPHRR